MKEKKSLHKPNSIHEKLNPDRILLKLFTKNRRNHLIRMSIFFTKLGNGPLWILISYIVFIYNVPKGLAFQIAMIVQLYVQIVLKNMFKRLRPYQQFADIEVLYNPPDPYSFPSGHTCAAFTMTFVARAILPVIWPYLLIIALIIAFARIYLAAHYPSDVFGGIVIAYLTSKFSIYVSTLLTGFPL